MKQRFTVSAEIYDTVYAGIVDYRAAGAELTRLIRARNRDARSLLEVGCGTGAMLEQLAGEFDLFGVDLSGEMLAIARSKPFTCAFRQADMAAFDLGCTFDAVICMFSSIGYMTDLEGLQAAYDRMAAHLGDGGVLVVEAWFTPECFKAGRVGGSAAGDENMRVHRVNTSWLEEGGRVSVMDMHHLIGRAGRRHPFRRTPPHGTVHDRGTPGGA